MFDFHVLMRLLRRAGNFFCPLNSRPKSITQQEAITLVREIWHLANIEIPQRNRERFESRLGLILRHYYLDNYFIQVGVSKSDWESGKFIASHQ